MLNSVVFVSLGPGDPELITLKGLKELQSADVVFCPSTVLPDGKTVSRAMEIILQLGIEQSKVNLFGVPMNKDRSLAVESYKDAATAVAERYRAGHKVVIAAEGDAGFYSSIHYIYENLQADNIAISRIAGVPAFIACGALANIHIVRQEEKLQIIPGIITLDELRSKLFKMGTLVIMKASQCESSIKKALQTPNTDFHYFENVGIPDKEFYTSDKSQIINRQFPYFSLIIIQQKSQ